MHVDRSWLSHWQWRTWPFMWPTPQPLLVPRAWLLLLSWASMAAPPASGTCHHALLRAVTSSGKMVWVSHHPPPYANTGNVTWISVSCILSSCLIRISFESITCKCRKQPTAACDLTLVMYTAFGTRSALPSMGLCSSLRARLQSTSSSGVSMVGIPVQTVPISSTMCAHIQQLIPVC